MCWQVTITQEQNDVYLIEQLLQDMDDGRGKRIRDHGALSTAKKDPRK